MTAVHIEGEKIYTGDLDGVVAVWSLYDVLTPHKPCKVPLVPDSYLLTPG